MTFLQESRTIHFYKREIKRREIFLNQLIKWAVHINNFKSLTLLVIKYLERKYQCIQYIMFTETSLTNTSEEQSCIRAAPSYCCYTATLSPYLRVKTSLWAYKERPVSNFYDLHGVKKKDVIAAGWSRQKHQHRDCKNSGFSLFYLVNCCRVVPKSL